MKKKPDSALSDFDSNSNPSKRIRINQSSTPQSQITQANRSTNNGSVPLTRAFGRVLQDITNLSNSFVCNFLTPSVKQQSFTTIKTQTEKGNLLFNTCCLIYNGKA